MSQTPQKSGRHFARIRSCVESNATAPVPRREFLKATTRTAACLVAAGAGFPTLLRAEGTPRASGMSIRHGGSLILDSPLPGETRAEMVAPAHPNGWQLAKDRFLVLYATRGCRGIDDDRSICFQLRSGGYDGPILREGHLSRCVDDWDAVGDGKKYIKQHGHPVVFGVPKGALIGGKVPAHAGVFVIKWRVIALLLDEKGEVRADMRGSKRVGQGVEWMQVRLNTDGSDLEIIQPAVTMRQVGFETGAAVCSLPRYGWMNQTYVNAVPCNDACTEWVDVNHFVGDRIAALRYRFNAAKGRYEWIETGPWLVDPKGKITEASVLRWKDSWLVAMRLSGAAVNEPGRLPRPGHGVGWWRTDDLFQGKGELTCPPKPQCSAARSAYVCADGIVRVFSGDIFVPPPARGQKRNSRNPIYAWDIDPDHGFAASEPNMIFNAFAAAPKIRATSTPMVDMVKALPATGGRSQMLLHRFTFAPASFPLTPEEIAAFGVYQARMEFSIEARAA